jgi:tRNA dimethylallyltransferase
MNNYARPLPLLVILGPTASGKTEVSLLLTEYYDIEIISADSRQLYKGLDIGTATPSTEELAAAPHHFVSNIDPEEHYSAGRFGSEAWITALDIASRGRLPVVVGGSGLYIKALCEGLFEEEPSEDRFRIRAALEEELRVRGIDGLYDELKEVDPASAELYHDRNPRRIIRALEYWRINKEPFSQAHKEYAEQRNTAPEYFAIDFPRKELYDRINRRAEIMWEQGLIEETRSALESGMPPDMNALNTVGYKEAIAYLNGDLHKDEAIGLMKRNTRRYAKRQLTWFRRYEDVSWLSGSPAEIAAKIYEVFHARHPEIPVK